MPKSRRHYRVRFLDVHAAHRQALELGGKPGEVSRDAIESAIARPYSGFGRRALFPRIHQKAAALVHALIKNHGFIDGNKRTAVIAVNVLLEHSGYELNASNAEVEWMAITVADSKLDLSALTDWFQAHIRRMN